MNTPNTNPKEVRRPVTNAAEAAELCAQLHTTADQITVLLARETELLKTIKVDEITPLQEEKNALVQAYLGQYTKFKDNAAFIKAQMPNEIEQLRHQQAGFQEVLQTNLNALEASKATTHGILSAIFEIVREQQGGPTVYGGNANMTNAQKNQTTAIVIDRAL